MQKPRWQVYNPSVILLFLLVLTILGSQTAAQNVTFKKRIDNGTANRGTGILESDSSYIGIGWGYPHQVQTRYVKLYKTNFSGNIISFKEYGSNNAFWETGESSVVKTFDGNYVLGGTRSDINGNDGLIIKFDKNLDTLWVRIILSSNHIFFYQTRETTDKGLVFVGSSDELDPNANFILVKTDSLGNEEWRKEYGGVFRDIGRTIDLTPDGGFIIAGDKYKDNTLDSRIGYLIKTDSLGNIEWDREFGSGFDDGVFRASTTTDGGYIVWGALDTIDHLLPAIPFLAKLDKNGTEEWRKVFIKTSRKSSFLFQAKELANGNFLAAGEIRNDVLPYAIGWLVMESPTGSTLWERFYYWNIDSVMPISFNDFIETSDGGILLTGYAGYWDEFGAGGTQFLLMKLDSNGCLVNDCGLFTGIEEYVPQQTLQAKLYPNPTTGTLTIELPGGQGGSMALYNLLGQSVYQTTLAGGQTTLTLNLPPGLYLYRIGSGNQATNGKLLVE
jgi:hypothetical protein